MCISITLDKERQYPIEPYSYKPNGLWVSVDSDYGWPHWCQDQDCSATDVEQEEDAVYREGPGLEHKYDVTFKADANILVMDSPQKLIDFTETYKIVGKEIRQNDPYINWKIVKAYYDGILISPYHRSMRYKYMWYYGFDCASGCIWNLSCIDTFKHETSR